MNITEPYLTTESELVGRDINEHVSRANGSRKPSRDLSSTPVISGAARREHDKAEAAEKDSYIDPDTGFQVFTAQYLKSRVWCCSTGCRHCPW